MTYNDPGDEATGRHAPRRRTARKTSDPLQNDLLSGPLQPPRTKSVGEQRKDKALAQHEDGYADRLEFLRQKLRELYLLRVAHVRKAGEPEPGVSADDAHRILAQHSNLGYLDDDEARPWFGAIFRGEGWQRTGAWVPSIRASNNGRLIPTWKWVGP